MHTKIPDPTAEPFRDVEPACRFLGIGRSLGYELIRRGEFPVPGGHLRNANKGSDQGTTRGGRSVGGGHGQVPGP